MKRKIVRIVRYASKKEAHLHRLGEKHGEKVLAIITLIVLGLGAVALDFR